MPPALDALRGVSVWDVVAVLIAVGVVVAGLKWLAPAVRWLRSTAEALHDLREALYGTPEERDASGAIIRPAHPGLLARVQSIEYHVQPNHGGSAWDAMKRGQDELRGMVSDALAEIGEFRREYSDELAVNHPDYRARGHTP